MFRYLALTSATSVCLAGACAWAQTAQRTTATYGDWVIRCELHEGIKNCEMAQVTQANGQTLTQIVLGRQAKDAPLKLLFQVPVNVSLPAGVRLIGEGDQAAVVATFGYCVPVGCFAVTDVTDNVIKKLRGLTANGKLEFKDAAGKDVAIPVSFKGFGEAYDVLTR
jgi:invasion protein IalB